MIKIAIHNPYYGLNCAETTVSKRYEDYFNGKGKYEFREVLTREQIDNFNPDFVLSHSNYAPKISKYPTYLVLNESTKFRFTKNKDFETDTTSTMLRSNLTFDGYLTQSTYIKEVLEDYCFAVGKKANILQPFANSFPQTDFTEIDLKNLKIVYFGTNWEVKSGLKPRFEEFFTYLTDQTDKVSLYGPQGSWDWLKKSQFYQGFVSYENHKKFLEVYRENGIALCLTRDDFLQEDIANNRIYEAAAAGCIIIADDLPFLRKTFGDSILYLTPQTTLGENRDIIRNEREMAMQVITHLDWINKNKNKAIKMAEKSHDIFCRELCMDVMMERAIQFHEDVSKNNYLSIGYDSKKSIDVIIRTGTRDVAMFKRALDSVANQTYQNITPIIVLYKERQDIKDLLKNYASRFGNIKILECFDNIGDRSATLWAGLNAVDGELFAILDDDDEFYQNYLSLAVDYLENEARENTGFIYTGKIYYNEDGLFEKNQKKFASSFLGDIMRDINNIHNIRNKVNMGGFGHISYKRFLNLEQPTSTMIVARSKYLTKKVLKYPKLQTADDFYLSLALFYESGSIEFLPYLAAQINIRNNTEDHSTDINSSIYNSLIGQSSKNKITRMLFHREFTANYRYISDRCNSNSEDHNSILDNTDSLSQNQDNIIKHHTKKYNRDKVIFSCLLTIIMLFTLFNYTLYFTISK